jgi:hypothetical protein
VNNLCNSLNFDGNPDLMGVREFGAKWRRYCVWLYDSRKKDFVKNFLAQMELRSKSDFDQGSLDFDTLSGQLTRDTRRIGLPTRHFHAPGGITSRRKAARSASFFSNSSSASTRPHCQLAATLFSSHYTPTRAAINKRYQMRGPSPRRSCPRGWSQSRLNAYTRRPNFSSLRT